MRNRLFARKIAYVHTGIFDDGMRFEFLEGTAGAFLRKHFAGILVGCGRYTPETAAGAIASGAFDLAAFGRPFIANPDLVGKIRRKEPLASYEEGMLKTLF